MPEPRLPSLPGSSMFEVVRPREALLPCFFNRLGVLRGTWDSGGVASCHAERRAGFHLGSCHSLSDAAPSPFAAFHQRNARQE
jgi:hypothetical protein